MTQADHNAPGTKTVARQNAAPEDEDLFDFPVIEMVLEGETLPERHTVGEVAAPAASVVPAPTKPAPAVAAATPAPTAAAPAPAPKQPALPKNAPSKQAEVEQAAELIDGLEEVLDDELEHSRLARRGKRRAPVVTAMGSPMAMLGGMLLLNLLTFGFFWYTSHNFRDGLEALRDDLLLATRSNAASRNDVPHDSAPSVPTPQAHAPIEPGAHVDPKLDEGAVGNEHVEPAPPNAEHGADTKESAHPLAAFERTTLELARQELQTGEVLSARKRLHRLLALADRMDPELKSDVEARARFLVAESYRAQAATKEKRQEEAAAAASVREDQIAKTAAPASVNHEPERKKEH
ncbi:MAG: hypothetical protein HZA53_07395 [Planctomycetes bacterium]|nr:hypothetical protein [Planctomycetota bacterium]